MIECDRILLARAMRVNQELGRVTVALFATQNGGELTAKPLRLVGEQLRDLADAMLHRADELAATQPVRDIET
ncbi:hypothetical protein EV191_104169 [Tamaricihabitans halophyticus]|uniref:Uncharacterized protein n=1 Tax=Tamaricihabitans halophyticus TaxID=1262583 RepID=A0A4R2QUD9_9PSEU|nr:hypothetical protein [Tamaricihabitans halophyticus]TCP53602.1 hypothetical protein EV191_104169 [Tamaricihabitans halophyticus]